jgi:oxepin-CoA hydrolase/3-oxo-5,6-dehydrosuberyl-CoA semialdehyde dehydrogenase
MRRLGSYVSGRWTAAAVDGEALVNPATEEVLATLDGSAVDRGAALAHARRQGGPALRELTFAQRAGLLDEVAAALQAARDELLALAIENGGNTRSDAKFDVDGAIATLTAYAEVGRSLGDARFLVDGDGLPLGRTPKLYGQHLAVPRRGVALHINAFNFPAWGLAEKAAVAWLAGMPVLTKPASASAMVAHRVVELIVAKQVLPEGTLSLLLGPPEDLLEHLQPQDVLAFTGSGTTAAAIRTAPAVVRNSVRVNVEADSLNAAVLGPDVSADSETYALFVKDVVRDMTQKAGQKCTAIRRIVVPSAIAERVANDVAGGLRAITVGNPALDAVRMGPLASRAQLDHVREGLARLRAEARVVADAGGTAPIGVENGRGFFAAPVLLSAGPEAAVVHSREVFGPVATLLTYAGAAADAALIVARGNGGLVASLYSDDAAFLQELALELAPFHGRLFFGNGKIAEVSPGPGTVLPPLIHGGPGHAGGGEELGGPRALPFYMQRVALEGHRSTVERIANFLPPR